MLEHFSWRIEKGILHHQHDRIRVDGRVSGKGEMKSMRKEREKEEKRKKRRKKKLGGGKRRRRERRERERERTSGRRGEKVKRAC